MNKGDARRITEDLRTRAFVRNMVEQQLEERDRSLQEGDPVVTFSVRLSVTQLAQLQAIGEYLGHKKTPFASMLLDAAIDDAFFALEIAEAEKGRRDEFLAHMEKRIELEEGGSVEFKYSGFANGEGEGE